MTTTARSANITSAAWVELSDGSANVTVDLDLTKVVAPDVIVRVDTSLPSASDWDGFRLDDSRRAFPLSGLVAGDKVYARSTGADTTVIVAKS